MRKFLAIVVCKLGRFVGKLVGKGSSMPGKFALKICPDILKRVQLPPHIIAVTGSTCTVLRRENEAVVEAFLKSHPDYRLEPFSVPGLGEDTPGYLTLWPHVHGTDGFFIAKLRRANGEN